jgi:hypothetical protein
MKKVNLGGHDNIEPVKMYEAGINEYINLYSDGSN